MDDLNALRGEPNLPLGHLSKEDSARDSGGLSLAKDRVGDREMPHFTIPIYTWSLGKFEL